MESLLASAQAEGLALRFFTLSPAHESPVDPREARPHLAERRSGEHENGEQGEDDSESDDHPVRQDIREGRRDEIAAHAATAREGVNTIGRRGNARAHGCDCTERTHKHE